MTPPDPVVKDYDIPIGNPYTVQVLFSPVIDHVEGHFGISDCLSILGFTCLGIMTNSPQSVFETITIESTDLERLKHGYFD